MNRREFIKALGLGVSALTMPGCAPPLSCESKKGGRIFGKASVDKPNFIIIFCDDAGYADVGCFGAEEFETPNLDRMAAEGVRFTDFYVAAASCTPSRAALMTGRYPQRVSLPHVLGPKAKIGISSEEQTIAELLKPRGYATACYGKWHLGHHPEFLPVRSAMNRLLRWTSCRRWQNWPERSYRPCVLMARTSGL